MKQPEPLTYEVGERKCTVPGCAGKVVAIVARRPDGSVDELRTTYPARCDAHEGTSLAGPSPVRYVSARHWDA